MVCLDTLDPQETENSYYGEGIPRLKDIVVVVVVVVVVDTRNPGVEVEIKDN